MTLRINQQTENTLITQIKELDNAVRELKAGVQFTEAKMYEYTSGNSYDMTGTFATTTVANQIVAELIVTATSVDGQPFLSSFVPQVYIASMGAGYYHDTNTSTFGIKFNKIVTDNTSVTQYWVNIFARPSGTAGNTFYLKAYIYGSSALTVTYQRLI